MNGIPTARSHLLKISVTGTSWVIEQAYDIQACADCVCEEKMGRVRMTSES